MEKTLATHESVGTVLLETREHYGITRAVAAERTKIPEKFIEMLEDDSYSNLPDDIYAKIFLKTYCMFLGLDTTAVLDLYREQRVVDAALSRRDPSRRHPHQALPTGDLVVAPKLIRSALIVAAFLGLFGYVGWEVMTIVAPPQVSLQSPADGLVTPDRTIAIEGVTQPEVTLRINGIDVPVSNDGSFSEQLMLQEGLNTIKVTASKKHSKELTVTRRIIVEASGKKTGSPLDPGLSLPTTPVDAASPAILPDAAPQPAPTQ